MPKPPTSIRLADDILARIDRLVEPLAQDEALRAGASTQQVTRATVLRLALLRGLSELELEQQQTSPAEVPRGKTAPRRR